MKTIITQIKKNKIAYLWMSLAIFIVAFSTVYPIIFSFDYSLWSTDIFTKKTFVGFQNYKTVLTDREFWASVNNSMYFTFGGVVITYIFGFILAFMLRKKTKINSFYRTIILIPWVTNEIAFSLMWLWMINPQLSPLNYWFSEMGLTLPLFLNNPDYALTTITIINGLRAVGFALVMILAALATIPKEVEEAAEIDGCVGLKSLWYIYLPMVKQASLIIIIIITISYFNIIGMVLLMTGGGPLQSTELLSVKLYKEGFSYFNIAIASTLTTIMLFINIAFAWIYSKLIKTEGMY